MLKSTKRWSRWWRDRKIDWKTSYLDGWTHPHRRLIVEELAKQPFGSVCEVGCASGPNLVAIRRAFPKVQLGGVDVNAEAVALAKKVFPDGIFDVRSAHDLFFSDKSVDVTISDMALIYLSPKEFRKSLSEIRRITRKRCVFTEFHSDSWLKRIALRLGVGYNAYDWPKELRKAGYHDVQLRKLTEADWPGGEPQKTFGWVITCRV